MAPRDTPPVPGIKAFHDAHPPAADLRADVLAGLAATPKSLPAKYLYDESGSRLFDRICTLPEYYPTRTETAILDACLPDVAARVPEARVLVEPGAGALAKVARVLDALPGLHTYLPIDIARDFLLDQARRLARDRPAVDIIPVCGDFTRALALPEALVPPGPRLVFFPGSTIGNFEPDAARALLGAFAELAGSGGALLLGADLRKDPAVLRAAYDDAAGVTAAFNRNLLWRINRELAADFAPDAFAHEARWNAGAGRVEMHLRCRTPGSVTVAGTVIPFTEGETIHTENSYKFTLDGFRDLARAAGLAPEAAWTDDAALFSVHLLRVP